MIASLLLAATLSQGATPEAIRIAAVPMDTTRAIRSLQIIRDGDSRSKILMIDKWGREHVQIDRYLTQLGYGVAPQPAFDEYRAKQREELREEAATVLTVALNSGSPEVSQAALEAMLRMQMVSLEPYRREPQFGCGTGLEPTVSVRVSPSLSDLAKRSPGTFLPYLGSSDVELRFGACEVLEDVYPVLCYESLRPLLSSKDQTLALAVAVSMTWLKPSSPFVDPKQPMFWSKSPVIRAWLLHSIEWPKDFDSPYENLTPLEKQVILERRDPKEAILRKALAEYDLNLVRTAAEALGDRLAAEEASTVVTRLLKSDYRADFINAVSLCWKYQGKQEAIRQAMDAPEAVRPLILEFIGDMKGEESEKTANRVPVPTHFELVPRLMSCFERLREVVSIDLGDHTFEEWRPTLSTMMGMKNPIAREIAANSLGELLSQKGVSPNKEAFDLARRVGFDPSPAVAGVAIQYSGLPTELQLAIFTRAYPLLDDEGRWGAIRAACRFPAPVADVVLKRIAAGSNPQDAEMAREAIAFRKRSGL